LFSGLVSPGMEVTRTVGLGTPSMEISRQLNGTDAAEVMHIMAVTLSMEIGVGVDGTN
jgi:hypothetical protein